ncbi:alpha/beta hydrolase, partial [Staphylococcus pseudintermedius]
MSLANYETNIMKLSQSNDAGLEVAIMGKQETDKAVV